MNVRNRPLGDYAGQISRKLYDRIPKAVLAAIALSPNMNGGCGDVDGTADDYLLREWGLLYAQRIVSQKPPRVNGPAVV